MGCKQKSLHSLWSRDPLTWLVRNVDAVLSFDPEDRPTTIGEYATCLYICARLTSCYAVIRAWISVRAEHATVARSHSYTYVASSYKRLPSFRAIAPSR